MYYIVLVRKDSLLVATVVFFARVPLSLRLKDELLNAGDSFRRCVRFYATVTANLFFVVLGPLEGIHEILLRPLKVGEL